MSIIIANDTGCTSNPGCQGTVACLTKTLGSQGIVIQSKIPVGYGYARFRMTPEKVVTRTFPNWIRKLSGYRKPDDVSNSVKWEKSVSQLQLHLAPLWKNSSWLLVNGEGTIHHNAIGAMALLGMCEVAKRLGMHVALVNCSIFELDTLFLEILKNRVDFLAVREPASKRYLAGHGIDAIQAADCLFLAPTTGHQDGSETSLSNPQQPSIIYTPGVMASGRRIPPELVEEDVTVLSSTGKKVWFYIVEQEDEYLAAAAARAGASILPLGSLDYYHVSSFLAKADLVVSGRYHINIFSALAGTPFVPLETNTLKTKGLLELFGSSARVLSWSDTSNRRCLLDPEAAVTVPPEQLMECASLARKGLPQLKALPFRP